MSIKDYRPIKRDLKIMEDWNLPKNLETVSALLFDNTCTCTCTSMNTFPTFWVNPIPQAENGLVDTVGKWNLFVVILETTLTCTELYFFLCIESR